MINLCFLAKIRSGTTETIIKSLIMLSEKINRKSRFNTYLELVAVPTGTLIEVEGVIFNLAFENMSFRFWKISNLFKYLPTYFSILR